MVVQTLVLRTFFWSGGWGGAINSSKIERSDFDKNSSPHECMSYNLKSSRFLRPGLLKEESFIGRQSKYL